MVRRICVVTVILLSCASVFACDVPVFRYALERWENSAYRVVVLHPNTEVDAEYLPILEAWRKSADGLANVSVVTERALEISRALPVPVSVESDGDTLVGPFPEVFLLYPDGMRSAWDGSLSQAKEANLITSPVREELFKRLTGGDTGIWVLLRSGDEAADAAAEKLLSEQLAALEKTLKLPEETADADVPKIDDAISEKALRISFAVIPVNRDDPEEQVLVSMLLGTEPDLRELEGPMAFPVYGRGRALYALIGAGINEETIAEACQFLVGPCSCQIKDQNPGMDLLITGDWDAAITPLLGGNPVAEELPSPAAMLAAVESVSTGEVSTASATSSEEETQPPRNLLHWRLLTLAGAGVAVLLGVTVKMLSRKA